MPCAHRHTRAQIGPMRRSQIQRGSLSPGPMPGAWEHVAAAPSPASASAPPRPPAPPAPVPGSSSLACAGAERSLIAGAGSDRCHCIRKPRPHPPRPPRPHPPALLWPSVVRTEERKKHGADRRRGRRSMASTGVEEEEAWHPSGQRKKNQQETVTPRR